MKFMMKEFIDTNIIIYSIIATECKEKHEISKNLILSHSFTASTQVINESLYTLRKKKEIDCDRLLDEFFEFFNIVTLLKSTLISARELRNKYQFSYWDSFIVASALESDCSILYTEDMKHEQLIEGKLRIINPFI